MLLPTSHTLWAPHDTVKDAAELLGVTLSDETARNLAMDVEYRIHEVLELAAKFMRHGKRRLLTAQDMDKALRLLNVEPLYGYSGASTVAFKEAIVLETGQTLYYVDQPEVEFEKLINQPLPRVPRVPTFTAHWLAIEGVQPAIPQNPTPSEVRALPPVVRGAMATSLAGASETVNAPAQSLELAVRPLVKHVLSKESQVYFDKVAEVLVGGDAALQSAVFNSLRQDPGLHQLVPYLIQFVAEQITNHLRLSELLGAMLEVVYLLLLNPTLFLEPYVHALMPCVLTLLLATRLGPEGSDEHFAIRRFAASLLGHICKSYTGAYPTLKPRVTRTLLRAFLDPSKPAGTHYGALLGLREMGPEVVRLVVVGNLEAWTTGVLAGLLGDDKTKLEEEVVVTLRVLKGENGSANGSENGSETENKDAAEIKDAVDRTALVAAVGDQAATLILDQEDGAEIAAGILSK